jgi:hypothetical protein
VQLGASTSPLGSRRTERPSVGNGAQMSFRVTVPIGATRFEARIGNPGDKSADLDLVVTLQGQVMGASADGDSEESVVIDNPPAGGYTIWIDGYSVPSGNTDFDYFDEIRTGTLGTVATTFAPPLSLAHGATATVTAKVTADALMPSGRQLFGVLDLVSTTGAVVGQAEVSITGVHGPSVHVGPIFGPMMALSARGGVVAGSAQIDGVGTPARWTEGVA